MIVSRCTRYTYTYGLRDLQDTSNLLVIKKFVSQLGRKPSRMIADRDFKLIGGIVADYLELHDNNTDTTTTTQLTGASTGRQIQNDLVEWKWKNVMNMARNWLASNLLPTLFWFFAIKYTVQVHNYIPIHSNNTWSHHLNSFTTSN